MIEDQLLVTVSDAARLLGLTESMVRCSLSRGTFPIKTRRIGKRVYFSTEEIRKFVETGEATAIQRKVGRPRGNM